MRKLKLQVQLSVDGYMADPNGELDWMTWDMDEKLWGLINANADSSDTILMGRKMTDGFIEYWEGVEPDSTQFAFAKKMTGTPKVVFSKTLSKSTWNNTTLATGDLVEEVTKLKNQTGKDILVYGGAGFASSLLKEGLIDEFNFFVHPVMINKGMRIFDLLNKRQKLTLLHATGYDCGIAVLSYKLNNE